MASAATMTTTPGKRKRRPWIRFGLLTLLGLVALSAIVLALVVNPARRQRRAVAYVRSLGGTVDYEAPGNTPSWLRKSVGEDYFDVAIFVNLGNTPVRDAGIEHLQGLTGLRVLALGYTQVGDAGLEHLQGLTGLELLYLRNTQVSDAGLEHLEGLNALRVLELDGAKVGDAGLEHLKRMTGLQSLDLSGTQVSDASLKHLKGLTRLVELDLSRTRVSDHGLAELRNALPGCKIRPE